MVEPEGVKTLPLSNDIKQSLWLKYQAVLKSSRDMDYDLRRNPRFGKATLDQLLNPNKVAEFKANLRELARELHPKLLKRSDAQTKYPNLFSLGDRTKGDLDLNQFETSVDEIAQYLEDLGVTNIEAITATSEFDFMKKNNIP